MKKCKKHFSEVSLKWNEPMDTNFYEIGTSDECFVCAREKDKLAALVKKQADDFAESMTTFLTTDAGTERKKRLLIYFLSS